MSKFIKRLRNTPLRHSLTDVMISYLLYTAISIKVVPEQSGKVEYERERVAGNRKKLTNFLAIPSKPFALVFDFSALIGTTLIIEIAVFFPYSERDITKSLILFVNNLINISNEKRL
jgi:hypothetical protein